MTQSLAERAQRLSPELLRALRWMEAHQDDVALRSLRECARRSGIVPSTFTRLARALRYEGYEQLRGEFQDRAGGLAARARSLHRRGLGWLEALHKAHCAASDSVAELNPRDALEAVADKMLAARRVYFFGLRASHALAFHLHYSYSLLVDNGVLVAHVGGALVDSLDSLHAGDLVVAVSLAPYSRQTVESVASLKARGVTLVAITDSDRSPLAANADATLLFKSDSPGCFQSAVGALALGEALAAAVSMRGGERVLRHLREAQRRLADHGAYVETGSGTPAPPAPPPAPPPPKPKPAPAPSNKTEEGAPVAAAPRTPALWIPDLGWDHNKKN